MVGTSDACIATHPSDMAVAMQLLDAVVETVTPDGSERHIPLSDFYCSPGDSPQRETVLTAGELIVAVTLPPPIVGTHVYRKIRDRASYAFALVSVAAIIQPDGNGRVALGGVAHKPRRMNEADKRIPRVQRRFMNNCSLLPTRLQKMNTSSFWRSAHSPQY